VGKQKFTAEQVAQALEANKGLAAVAAEQLGCTVSTVYNYANRYERVREVLAHQKEKRLDIAEGQLWQLINMGNVAAIIFYLKTQGKRRGYTERHEVQVSGEDIDAAIEQELARLAGQRQAGAAATPAEYADSADAA